MSRILLPREKGKKPSSNSLTAAKAVEDSRVMVIVVRKVEEKGKKSPSNSLDAVGELEELGAGEA